MFDLLSSWTYTYNVRNGKITFSLCLCTSYVKPIINLINDMVRIISSFCRETITILNFVMKIVTNDITCDIILAWKFADNWKISKDE